MEGHVEVASTLISKATALLHQKDNDGRTTLHLAAANGHKDLLTILIGQGAEIDAQDNVSGNQTCLLLLFVVVCDAVSCFYREEDLRILFDKVRKTPRTKKEAERTIKVKIREE